MDGIFGLSLSPKVSIFKPDLNLLFNGPQNRVLYFHALASTQENIVPLSVINNPVNFLKSDSQAATFSTIGTRGIQTAAQAMDSNGNLFFVLMNPIVLACWDSSTAYLTKNIKVVLENRETLQFASGLKIIRNREGAEEIWIMTNRYQVNLVLFHFYSF